MKANMLSLHTPTTPGVGSKGHFFFIFSKSGHVAYQNSGRSVDLHARSGIFFGCIRGRYKAPVPMANAYIFPNLNKKIPNQKIIFM